MLSKLRPNKAPGIDNIRASLLKACGEHQRDILAILITKCFQLSYFPEEFKTARAVVLSKPGKTPQVYSTPKGYRPISLLPIIGKVIEAILAKRIAETAEEAGILPEGQFGCRRARSTEGALDLLVSLGEEAFSKKA